MTDRRHLSELTQPEVLKERLAQILRRSGTRGTSVGFAYDGKSGVATVGATSPGRWGGEEGIVATGCLTKLFTAALVQQAVEESRFEWESRITELGMAQSSGVAALLGATTVRQLLEHTHGLEDVWGSRIASSKDGFIDVPSLWAEVARVGRLAQPGLFYSYGDVGALIAGALLEQCFGKPYCELLEERLFTPLGMRVWRGHWGAGPGQAGNPICPATGGALAASVDDILRFLVRGKSCGGDLRMVGGSTCDSRQTGLPGWNLIERGVYRGWKCYGGGWYGHHSVAPTGALVRVSPTLGVALVVASEDRVPVRIAALLFGTVLSGLIDVRLPRQLSQEESRGIDAGRYVGRYGNESFAMEIVRSSHSFLELRVVGGTHGTVEQPGRCSVTALRPARHDILLTGPPPIDLSPFIQLIGGGAAGFEYLWDGRRIWAALRDKGPYETCGSKHLH